ncbi:MAG: S9 family peptidase [Steroidobacteraceae bacterium]
MTCRAQTRLSAACLILLAAASGLFTHAALAELPPLIDRQLFFGDPEIAGAQISPDGKFLAFLKPHDGVRNIWVKRTEEPFEKARPITADMKRPIVSYFWSRDAKYVLYIQDQAGDENYNVYAVDPTAAAVSGSTVPAARNLTDAKGTRAIIYAVPRKTPDVIYIGLNDRDKAWHDLYSLQISTGTRTLMRTNDLRATGWVFDLDGKLRLATRVADNGDNEILRVGNKSFTKIYTCTVFEDCDPSAFHIDGKRVYMVSNHGSGIDLSRLVLLDVQSGREELVETDPEKRVDFTAAIFSPRTDELIGTAYLDDKGVRLLWRDAGWKADYEHLRGKLPGRELNVKSTDDEQLWQVGANADVEPGEAYLFDRRTKKLTLQYRLFEAIPRGSLASTMPIRYPSSDGLEIPAYLTLPKGVGAKNLPLLVMPHGGPWWRDEWTYRGFTQFLANRGFAVLQPNFRGSTGYGKKFLDAGNKEWGDTMQDDVTWGVKHLVRQGVADQKRVAIFGASYGGYATLAGVTFTPDVYAAAASFVGPSNLITLLNTIPPYWEPIRKLFHERMGDPSTPEGRAQLDRQSPLHSAHRIKTPLLVIQGANDPRVKQSESDQIVVALRDRGFPVEYLIATDEGHGFARPVNNMATFAALEKFLAKHIGTRYQESMPVDVAQRLKELTVDPKSVVVKKSGDAVSGRQGRSDADET